MLIFVSGKIGHYLWRRVNTCSGFRRAQNFRHFVLKSYFVIIRHANYHVVLRINNLRCYILLRSTFEYPFSTWSTNETSTQTTGSKYGYIIRHGPFWSHAKYHCTFRDIGSLWRQGYVTWTESCCFMSVSNKLSYLLVNSMLLSQISATTIFIVKFERNKIALTNEDNLKCEFNWSMS